MLPVRAGDCSGLAAPVLVGDCSSLAVAAEVRMAAAAEVQVAASAMNSWTR